MTVHVPEISTSVSKTDSLEQFFSEFEGEGVEATADFEGEWHKINKSLPGTNHSVTNATDPTHVANTSAGSTPQDEFGFPLFPVRPSHEPVSNPAEKGFEQVIDCTKSFTDCSVSTMTKTAFPTQQSRQPPKAVAQTNKARTRKRSSPVGISKALSKLALCGNSAREDSLDLEYVVLTLRQAITAPDATISLRQMVKILKQGRTETESGSLSTMEIQEGLMSSGADHCVISTLWNFPSHVPVQYYGLIAIGELVAHSHLQNQKSIVLKGGVEVVLSAMKNHPAEETLQEEACRTLKNLMKYFDTAKQHVARHNGIFMILQAMMTHPEYAGVQRQACYALTSLSCLKVISDEIVSKQGHAVLLKVMQHHNDDCFVLAEAWRTLTNIVIHSMNMSLDEEIAAYGLDIVCQSLHRFADCALVPIQARGLTLLTHLCYRSRINLDRLTLTQNLEIIHRVLRLWKHDEKVQTAGEKLVKQISEAGYSLPQKQQKGRYSNRVKKEVPSATAVISQIRGEQGLDVIVDTTMY